MNEPEGITKLIRIRFEDYNTMTQIAKQNGFVKPDGKMHPAMVVSYLIKNFSEKIA